MTLIVNEIFHSIQGESSLAGLPFVFVRLTGCNLRCRHCDTKYAYDEGTPWSVERIVGHATRFSCRRITVTGGEPLTQAMTPQLIAQLLDQDLLVTLETNGSMDVASVDPRCIKIVDVKCPSSGMHERNLWNNLKHLNQQDQIKFVIADKPDFDFACEKAATVGDRIPAGQILFSPVHGILPPEQLAGWMLETRMEARLQIQLHKYLWPAIQRGV